MTGGGSDVTGRAIGTDLVPAVGGTRTVPAPDPVARDYILLALRLDQHIPGLVDGYFGPADLKATGRHGAAPLAGAPARRRRWPCAIASRPRSPIRTAVSWLDAQLVALETQAGGLAGDDPAVPGLRHALLRVRAAALPGRAVRGGRGPDRGAASRGRSAGRSARGVGCAASSCPVDRLPGVVDWLVARFRDQAAADFGLPDGEDLRVSLVTGQPWSAYNWFDGGRRSRVDVNTDLPVRASDLIGTIAHETYPGHHLEHAWKEADLVDTQGRLESSILLINTPECLISEGLADLGVRFAAPPQGRVDLLVEMYERAGLPIAADPAATREAAESSVALADRSASGWAAISGNAAILRHADGRSHDEVVAYLRDVGRYSAARAEKRARIHRAPAVADLRLRLRRGRGAPRAAGSRPSRNPSVPPGSGASSTSS